MGKVSEKAKNGFLSAIKEIDITDTEQLKRIGKLFLSKYGLACKELAAQWYDYCRGLAIGGDYAAEIGEVSSYGIASGIDSVTAKFAAGEIAESDYIARLGGLMVKQVYREVQSTIMGNLRGEYNRAIAEGNSAFAKKIGFCRVPSFDACAFCVLLASQAFYSISYVNALSAGAKGNEYHDDCRCIIVPFSDAKKIVGYGDTLKGYVDAYENARDLRSGNDMPEDLKQRIELAKAEHDEKYKSDMERYQRGEISKSEVIKPWSSVNANLIVMRYQNPGMR